MFFLNMSLYFMFITIQIIKLPNVFTFTDLRTITTNAKMIQIKKYFKYLKKNTNHLRC